MKDTLKNTPKGVKLSAAGLAALISLLALWEGYRATAYLDPVGIPTICFGHIKGVKLGDVKSRGECEGLLLQELAIAESHVDRCIKTTLSEKQRIALISFVYNVGPAGVCGSTLQKRFNSGLPKEGCAEMRRWVFADGRKLQGLVNRRKQEAELCLSGS